MIDSFEGDFEFLSNFFLEPDGTTVEHEFQAAKTADLEWKLRILTAPTPGQAKRLGRKAPLRPEWEQAKVNEMRALVFKKFLDHPTLAAWLMETTGHDLVEGNHWHDQFWGVCVCGRCPAEEGLNKLGRILMEIRDLGAD